MSWIEIYIKLRAPTSNERREWTTAGERSPITTWNAINVPNNKAIVLKYEYVIYLVFQAQIIWVKFNDCYI